MRRIELKGYYTDYDKGVNGKKIPYQMLCFYSDYWGYEIEMKIKTKLFEDLPEPTDFPDTLDEIMEYIEEMEMN
tara:strand:+ start:223 stop:444 length:222 start_codon:yes stop_codon:yes gene_type:complete